MPRFKVGDILYSCHNGIIATSQITAICTLTHSVHLKYLSGGEGSYPNTLDYIEAADSSFSCYSTTKRGAVKARILRLKQDNDQSHSTIAWHKDAVASRDTEILASAQLFNVLGDSGD